MSGYTLGPWTVWRDYNVVANDGRIVATCGGHSNSKAPETTHEENVANARLVAAAPDMLEALKAFMNFVDGRGGTYSQTWSKIAAAIRKAEGRD